MTGISALRMVWTMVRMERSSPPGVLSWTTSAWARSARARATAAVRRCAVTGVMTPSMSITATGWAARAGPAPARARPASTMPATVILRIRPPLGREAPETGSERAAKAFDRLGQARDLGGRIVDRKNRAGGGAGPQPRHEGPGGGGRP